MQSHKSILQKHSSSSSFIIVIQCQTWHKGQGPGFSVFLYSLLALPSDWSVLLRVPEVVVSDNATNLTSAEFEKFASKWNFAHVTSSPHYPQANGAAERAVHIAKDILKQEDCFEALLVYHATPVPELGASPAFLAYGRKLRTTLPVLPRTLLPQTVNREEFEERNRAFKQRQKANFDRHNGVQSLPTCILEIQSQ